MTTWTIICGFCHTVANLYHRDDLSKAELAAHKRHWMDAIGWDMACTEQSDRPNVWRCNDCKDRGIGFNHDPRMNLPKYVPQDKGEFLRWKAFQE